MSQKEIQRRKISSEVFKEAWKLKKRTILFTYQFGAALKLAWKTVRSQLRYYYSKVRGASFHNRQKLLQRLSMYEPNDIILEFQREPENPVDPMAIAIIASIRNKGSAVIGYVAKELAAQLSPVLDAGKQAVVIFDEITGIGRNGCLGCNFRFFLT